MLVINRFYSITLLQLMIILVQRFINVYTTHSIYFLINPKILSKQSLLSVKGIIIVRALHSRGILGRSAVTTVTSITTTEKFGSSGKTLYVQTTEARAAGYKKSY